MPAFPPDVAHGSDCARVCVCWQVLRHEPPLKEPLAAHAAREVKSAAAVGNTAALRVSAEVLAVLGVKVEPSES